MRKARFCPVCCASASEATQFVLKNIELSRITDFSFSSRKSPEYMSHNMVVCQRCDLVYADSPPLEEELVKAYHSASYDSTEEANDAAQAYAQAILPILEKIKNKTSALEIGTGTGIFLDYLKKSGFSNVVGVEPSIEAIKSAPVSRQAMIINGIFDENMFEANSFDLICCFMTMEHVYDPLLLSKSSMRLLKPGGAFVTVTHDYRSVVNKLMCNKSPIIDIEHLQIFSKKSIYELFNRTGYNFVSVESFINRYSFSYWLKLSPIPIILKSYLERIFSISFFKRRRIGINVGNTITAGFKPEVL
jgi:SAM-dependent methyltransferase